MAHADTKQRELNERFRGRLGRIFQRSAIACGLAIAAISSVSGGSPVPVAHAAVPTAPLDLSAYRGKVVYLDFWASWCAPCRLSFQFMRMMNVSYGSRDLVIIPVNLDRDHAAAVNFLQHYGNGLTPVYDPAGTIATRYKVATMPTSVLIGRDGRVRFVHSGYFENKAGEYQQHIAALVAEHP